MIDQKALKLRIIGFVASLLLTLSAYWVLVSGGFSQKMTVVTLLILALLQGMFQAICFLHLSMEKRARWNLAIFVSTISIIIVIIIGSIWIMDHLNYNMMP